MVSSWIWADTTRPLKAVQLLVLKLRNQKWKFVNRGFKGTKVVPETKAHSIRRRGLYLVLGPRLQRNNDDETNVVVPRTYLNVSERLEMDCYNHLYMHFSNTWSNVKGVPATANDSHSTGWNESREELYVSQVLQKMAFPLLMRTTKESLQWRIAGK